LLDCRLKAKVEEAGTGKQGERGVFGWRLMEHGVAAICSEAEIFIVKVQRTALAFVGLGGAEVDLGGGSGEDIHVFLSALKSSNGMATTTVRLRLRGRKCTDVQ
jgi:hypothetical protein